MRKRNQFESPSHAQMRVATRSKKDDSGRETPRRTMAQPAISNRERLLRLTARYCTSVVSQSFDSSVRPEGSNFHRLALEAFGLLVARDLRRWLTTRQRFPSSVAGSLLLLLCCALATTQPRKVGTRHDMTDGVPCSASYSSSPPDISLQDPYFPHSCPTDGMRTESPTRILPLSRLLFLAQQQQTAG